MNNNIKDAGSFAGIHISGPNVRKTAVVIFKRKSFDKSLRLISIYDKIGTLGPLFSDDRLATILEMEGLQNEIVIDCPLGLPPCVACNRPTCPGVNQCNDISVAYMLSLAEKRKKSGKKRGRNLNPQTHRVWDVIQLTNEEEPALEPSYSSNMSPLVNRARILQRRLATVHPNLVLKETSIPRALEYFGKALGLPSSAAINFRKFEIGKKARRDFLERLEAQNFICSITSPGTKEKIYQSVEVFQAFISGIIANMIHEGGCKIPDENFPIENGWIYLPKD